MHSVLWWSNNCVHTHPPTHTRAHTHTHSLSLAPQFTFTLYQWKHKFIEQAYIQTSWHSSTHTETSHYVVLVAHMSLLSTQNLLTQQTQATIITVALYQHTYQTKIMSHHSRSTACAIQKGWVCQQLDIIVLSVTQAHLKTTTVISKFTLHNSSQT